MDFRTIGPARLALRDATSAAHEQLHHVAPFADLAAGRLTMMGYRMLLMRIHRFHRATAAATASARGALGLEPAASGDRLDLIEADLRWLGYRATRPVALGRGAMNSDEAVGCLYVVEGSMLGGKLIHRQLDYLFGSTDEARSFFRGSPEDGARWRRLCERIDAHGAAPGRIDRMISGAQATFALFETCLVEPLA